MLPFLVIDSPSSRPHTTLDIIDADISLLRLDYIQYTLHVNKTMAQSLASLEDALPRLLLFLANHGVKFGKMIASVKHASFVKDSAVRDGAPGGVALVAQARSGS